MNTFLTSNQAIFRLGRTIAQGIIGVIIANLDILIGYVIFDPEQRAIIVALVMAVLSPTMAALGEKMTYNSAIGGIKDDGKGDDYDAQ